MQGTVSIDELFMRRAFSLAVQGRGLVSPNPLVGSVIALGDRVIGEGWHRKYGGPHAEVEAIDTVGDKTLLEKATIYVNLEPCSHYGKTPPCADLLISHRIKRVVICNEDSNPLVAGNGIKKLLAAGIEVTTGVLEKEGRELNKRFFTFMEQRRPYIILKWAETADGYIARENRDSKWISNELSRVLVHKWRTEEDAVLVGRTTAQYDNPQLTARYWSGRNPVRVVLDRYLKLNRSLQLFDGKQNTICYNCVKEEESDNLRLIKIAPEGFPEVMLNDMARRGIQSVLVEGGSETLDLFIKAGLWDEARIFKSPTLFNNGIPAVAIRGMVKHREKIEQDELTWMIPFPATPL